MSAAGALARGQAAAEARMTDTCTARREVPGSVVYDDNTGATTPAWTALYAGPCRLKQPNAQASNSRVGEATVLLQKPELHLPTSAPLLQPGDEVTLSGSTFDPQSVGRVFRIQDVPAHSQATARRYGVVERTS